MHSQIKGTVFILRVLTVLLVTYSVQLEVCGHHASLCPPSLRCGEDI